MARVITDTPNEILFKVLDLLSNKEVDHLHAIPRFRRRLEQVVVLVTPENPNDLFHYIENKRIINTVPMETLRSQYYRIIVGMEVMDNSFADRLIMTTDYTGTDISVFMSFSPVLQKISLVHSSRIGTHFRSMCFETVSEFHLSDSNVVPGLLQLPCVSSIKFERCQIPNVPHDPKFNVPHLRSLKLVLSDQLLSYFDFDNLRIEEIELSICELETLSNWNWPSLKTFTTRHYSSLTAIDHMTFHNLTSMLLSDAQLQRLSNMDLPSLETLEVFSWEGLSIYDFSAPLLHTIKLRVFSLERFELENSFNISTANMDVGFDPEGPAQNDYACLCNVRTLTVSGRSTDFISSIDGLEHLILESSYTPQQQFCTDYLETLEITKNTELTDMSLHSWPALKSLKLSNFETVPELDLLPVSAPNLQHLVISCFEADEIHDLVYPSLETLELSASKESVLYIQNCEFENLTKFEFRVSRGSDDTSGFDSCMVDMLAPQLLELRIYGQRFDTFDASRFPCLESIDLDGAIGMLILSDELCQRLRSIFVCGQKPLKEIINATSFPNLTSLRISPSAININLDTPLLERTVMNYIVSYELKEPEKYTFVQGKNYMVHIDDLQSQYDEYEDVIYDDDVVELDALYEMLLGPAAGLGYVSFEDVKQVFGRLRQW